MIIELPPALVRKALADAIAGNLDDLDDLQLLKTSDAAKLFSITRKPFLALMRASNVNPVYLGPKTTRWKKNDLKQLIQNRQTDQ